VYVALEEWRREEWRRKGDDQMARREWGRTSMPKPQAYLPNWNVELITKELIKQYSFLLIIFVERSLFLDYY
jgi:hypothetical protein